MTRTRAVKPVNEALPLLSKGQIWQCFDQRYTAVIISPDRDDYEDRVFGWLLSSAPDGTEMATSHIGGFRIGYQGDEYHWLTGCLPPNTRISVPYYLFPTGSEEARGTYEIAFSLVRLIWEPELGNEEWFRGIPATPHPDGDEDQDEDEDEDEDYDEPEDDDNA
jgi:hypothetical protein